MVGEKVDFSAINDADKSSYRSQRRRKLANVVVVFCLIGLTVFKFSPLKALSGCYDFSSSTESREEVHVSGGAPSLLPDRDHLHIARHGAVACDVEICSQMGTSILEKGGSAADAAVTVALCIGSVDAFSSGIGGGGFITAKKYKEEAISIDAREMAPALSHKNMYKGRERLAQLGGLAIATPGELKGLYELFKRQTSGVLDWEDLITPVVELNRNGFVCTSVLEMAVNAAQEVIWAHQDMWQYVIVDNEETGEKRLIKEGDLVKRANLANTLELIARNGSDAIFYDPEGPLVKSMVSIAQKTGGIIQESDFSGYKVKVETALHTSFLGQDVYTSNGASSGVALVAGLNIIDGFGKAPGKDGFTLESHRLIESMKWMASVRSNLGDVVEHDLKGSSEKVKRIQKFLTDDWAEQIRTNMSDDETYTWEHYEPAYQMNEPKGTAHFSVVDKDYGAVSMTTTVNLLFGSMVKDPVTGVILNNEMDDFSLPDTPNAFGLQPSIYNFIEPFKRPLSSCTPSIVVNELNTPDLVIGAAGGSRIVTAVFQAIVRTYSYEMPILETISYPRLHHQLIPESIIAENLMSKELIKELEAKGHNITLIDPVTAMNGIRRWNGDWHAVSDFWRKRGEAWGY